MTHILFAVDGSPLAVEAIRRALDLVGPPATVTLLHAAPLSAPLAGAGGIEGPVYTPGEMQSMREAEQRDAEEILAEAATVVPAGYDVRRRLDEGDPGAAICTAADELGVDLVVLGNHGRNALARLVLGSTSTYVVHHCRRPVLVVRAHDDGDGAASGDERVDEQVARRDAAG